MSIGRDGQLELDTEFKFIVLRLHSKFILVVDLDSALTELTLNRELLCTSTQMVQYIQI